MTTKRTRKPDPTAEAQRQLQVWLLQTAAQIRAVYEQHREPRDRDLPNATLDTFTLQFEIEFALQDEGHERAGRFAALALARVWPRVQDAWPVSRQGIDLAWALASDFGKRAERLTAQQSALGIAPEDYSQAVARVKARATARIVELFAAHRAEIDCSTGEYYEQLYSTGALAAHVQMKLEAAGEAKAGAHGLAVLQAAWPVGWAAWPVTEAGLKAAGQVAVAAGRQAVRIEQRLDVFEIEAEAVAA